MTNMICDICDKYEVCPAAAETWFKWRQLDCWMSCSMAKHGKAWQSMAKQTRWEFQSLNYVKATLAFLPIPFLTTTHFRKSKLCQFVCRRMQYVQKSTSEKTTTCSNSTPCQSQLLCSPHPSARICPTHPFCNLAQIVLQRTFLPCIVTRVCNYCSTRACGGVGRSYFSGNVS